MATSVGQCKTIRVFTFRGDRTASYWAMLQQKFEDEVRGGTGPSKSEILLYAGHAGVSLDLRKTIYGFNPDAGNRTAQQVLNHLKNGLALPGSVHDDTTVFSEADKHSLTVLDFDVRVPQKRFIEIENELVRERRRSNYMYGFPNGDGECNCVTWLERIGIPLVTGRIDEFEAVTDYAINRIGLQRRRFGKCI